MDPSNTIELSLQGVMQHPVGNGMNPAAAQQLIPILPEIAVAAASVIQPGASQMVPPGTVAQLPTQSPVEQQQPVQTTEFDSAAPPVEIKLFVGRVPRTYDEESLRPIFSEHARVLEVAIIKDKSSGLHKGSAFVRLASITEADQAIRALNNIKVLDSSLGPLHVRYADGEAEKLGLSSETLPGQDQAKLFVGSLPKGVSEEEVRRVFSQFGQIDEIFLLKDPATQGCKGCAFVKFAYKEQALNAIKNLNRIYQFESAPRPLEVRFAEKKSQQRQGQGLTGGMGAVPGANMMQGPSNMNPRTAGAWKEYFTKENRPYYHNEMTAVTQWDKPMEFEQLFPPSGTPSRDVTGPPGANIFVFHIPNDWTPAELHHNFGQFGSILSAHIATDKATGRNKGYAFVSFDNINSAVNAVSRMNGFLANGKRLKVSIKQHEDKYVAHLLPPMAGMAQASPQMAGAAAMGGMAGMTAMTAMAGMPPQMAVGMAPGSPNPMAPVASLAAAASVIPQLQGPVPGMGQGGYGGYASYGGVNPVAGVPQAHHFAPY